MQSSSQEPILGIIISGGPAPGLNSLIQAAVEYSIRLHWKVIGFHDGYLHLITGNYDEVKANTIILNQETVLNASELGGSLVRTNRTDPTKTPERVANVVSMLKKFQIRYLLTLGSVEKITAAHFITQGVDPCTMQVIVIPLSIDNDVPLPEEQPTFGFHTARCLSQTLVKNLMVDAKSAPLWFIVETQGGHSGALALSIAEATSAPLVLIPEDFPNNDLTLKTIVDIIEATIIKRLALGKNYGTCIIAEGLIYALAKEEIDRLLPNREDRIVLDDVELSRSIRTELIKRLKEKNIPVGVTPKKIGYELRCNKPNSFDEEYSRALGYGAIEGFRQGHSNCIVVFKNNQTGYQSFRDIIDPRTGLIPRRLVNTKSQEYLITKQYTFQLRSSDMKNQEFVEKMAKAGNMSVEEFRNTFEHIVDNSC